MPAWRICLHPGSSDLSQMCSTRGGAGVCVTESHALTLCPMSTPTPHPGNTSNGSPLPGPRPSVDPERIRSDVDGLLARLGGIEQDPNDQHAAGVIPQKAHILEQAHEVLVQALASVDRA